MNTTKLFGATLRLVLFGILLTSNGLAVIQITGIAQAAQHAHGAGSQLPHIASVEVGQSATEREGIGSDPLTTEEIALARRTTQDSAELMAARTRAATILRPTRIQALVDIELLHTERHTEGKALLHSSRQADVYFYDYANDLILHQIVDLVTGKIQRTHTLAPKQKLLPVADIETAAALQLVLNHPKLGAQLRFFYERATGTALLSSKHLQAQGGLYHVNPGGDSPLDAITRICQFHRCIQLLIPLQDQYFIDAGNLVIDLSAGQLLWVDAALHAYIGDQPARDYFFLYLPAMLRQ